MITKVLVEPRARGDLGLVLLLDLALQELFIRYPASEPRPVHPATSFLVADVDGEAVGCIGLAPIVDGVGEINRLYVRPEYRGRGIGRRLLTAAEAVARHRGAAVLRVATGTRQPEAITLYESLDYRPIPPYGEHTHPTTRCYTKPLR